MTCTILIFSEGMTSAWIFVYASELRISASSLHSVYAGFGRLPLLKMPDTWAAEETQWRQSRRELYESLHTGGLQGVKPEAVLAARCVPAYASL